MEPHHRSLPHGSVECGSGSRTQHDQLTLDLAQQWVSDITALRPFLAKSGRRTSSGHRREGRLELAGGWRLCLWSDGTAIAPARSFFKSVAHACRGPARVSYFANQESKESRDRANWQEKSSARVHVSVHVRVDARVCTCVRVNVGGGPRACASRHFKKDVFPQYHLRK